MLRSLGHALGSCGREEYHMTPKELCGQTVLIEVFMSSPKVPFRNVMQGESFVGGSVPVSCWRSTRYRVLSLRNIEKCEIT